MAISASVLNQYANAKVTVFWASTGVESSPFTFLGVDTGGQYLFQDVANKWIHIIPPTAIIRFKVWL